MRPTRKIKVKYHKSGSLSQWNHPSLLPPPPCEDTLKSSLLKWEEIGPPWKRNWLVPWPCISQHSEWWKINFYHLSHLICSIFLKAAQGDKTDTHVTREKETVLNFSQGHVPRSLKKFPSITKTPSHPKQLLICCLMSNLRTKCILPKQFGSLCLEWLSSALSFHTLTSCW